METDEINLEGLEQLTKMFKNLENLQGRVGILGDGAKREGTTNAEIGLKHEFGDGELPQRSFLRVPVMERLEKYLSQNGLFDKSVIKKSLKDKSAMDIMKKIAVTAESIVLEAFATGGFGKWPKWRNPDYKNNTGMILVDTQQLRNSITSEVKEKK